MQVPYVSDRIGSLNVGAAADFTLLDDDLEVHKTWIEGAFDTGAVCSKGWMPVAFGEDIGHCNV